MLHSVQNITYSCIKKWISTNMCPLSNRITIPTIFLLSLFVTRLTSICSCTCIKIKKSLSVRVYLHFGISNSICLPYYKHLEKELAMPKLDCPIQCRKSAFLKNFKSNGHDTGVSGWVGGI